MASSRRAAPFPSPHMRRLPPLSHRHLTPQVVLGLYIVRGDNMCAMPPPSLAAGFTRACACQSGGRRGGRGGRRRARSQRDDGRASQAGRPLTLPRGWRRTWRATKTGGSAFYEHRAVECAPRGCEPVAHGIPPYLSPAHAARACASRQSADRREPRGRAGCHSSSPLLK